MNITEELEKFTKKEIIILEPNNEENIGKELKKSTLLLQLEIKELSKQINERNFEADSLRKELFSLKKSFIQKDKLILDFLDNTSTLEKMEENEVVKLMLEKEAYILKKNNISKLAEVNQDYNPKFHQALNTQLEKKEQYRIVEIIEQGYIENDKILKLAKVLVE
ncbi:MAG: nucleotide exchange factor GrpE [Aliarcobacter sp.]|nr:nucleotide exchange factor GrpE [Aliarcobacter sp.]